MKALCRDQASHSLWDQTVSKSPISPPLTVSSPHTGPRYTSRDWQGIRAPVDAAMVGRVYISPVPTPPPARRRSNRRRRPSKKRAQRRRLSRQALFDDFWGLDDLYDYSDVSDIFEESTTQEDKSTPVQNVYFFKRGMILEVKVQFQKMVCIKFQ